jgi:hypothetical protein
MNGIRIATYINRITSEVIQIITDMNDDIRYSKQEENHKLIKNTNSEIIRIPHYLLINIKNNGNNESREV